MTSLATSVFAHLLRVLAFGALLPLVALAQAPNWETGTDGLVPIPALSARVTDLTGTLGPGERQALEAKLTAFEQQSGGQFAVLLVPSTKGEPIEAYGIRVAEAWKIGRKGQDNGVILLVAKDDRKLRLEVGYGYEGVLTDAMSKRIIAETITPFFRQGQFAAGINAGVDRVIGVITKDPSTATAPPSRASPQRSTRGIDPGSLLVFLLVVVPVLGSMLRRMFGKLGGATVGAGLVGTGAAVVAGSILLGAVAAAHRVGDPDVHRRGQRTGCQRAPRWQRGAVDRRRRLGRRRRWRRLRRRRGRLRGRRRLRRLVSLLEESRPTMPWRAPNRIWRHAFTDEADVRRSFPADGMARIEGAIRAGEATHRGQVCVAVEPALPLGRVVAKLPPRERALEVFSQMRVWDTEENNGVLIYVLLADRDVEIVADRGIDRSVAPGAWEAICRRMEEIFRAHRHVDALESGVREVSALLAQHFPGGGEDRNELPDRPVVL